MCVDKKLLSRKNSHLVLPGYHRFVSWYQFIAKIIITGTIYSEIMIKICMKTEDLRQNGLINIDYNVVSINEIYFSIDKTAIIGPLTLVRYEILSNFIGFTLSQNRSKPNDLEQIMVEYFFLSVYKSVGFVNLPFCYSKRDQTYSIYSDLCYRHDKL